MTEKLEEGNLGKKVLLERMFYTGLGLVTGSILTATGLFLDNFVHDNFFIRDNFPTMIHKRIEIGPYQGKYDDALVVTYYWDDDKTGGGGITFFKDGDRYYATDEAFRKYIENKRKQTDK